MRLKVLLPTRVLIDTRAAKVIAEGPEGHFCLLPRHTDYVALIVPGILTYEENDKTVDTGAAEQSERYLGVDEGVLVKQGNEVRISLRDAVPGKDLAELRETVEQRFLQLDEQEKQLRSALARLEAGVVRRFLQLEER